jgi:hypothetical protein
VGYAASFEIPPLAEILYKALVTSKNHQLCPKGQATPSLLISYLYVRRPVASHSVTEARSARGLGNLKGIELKALFVKSGGEG